MINSNLNATVRINAIDLKKKDLYEDFSESEKGEMLASLKFIGTDFQTFILSFYEGFLGKTTLKFVQNQSEERLVNLVSTALNLIITCLQTPFPLAEYIDNILANYPNFPEIIKNNDLFVKSFMKAIIDSFKDNYTERLGVLWFKAVSTFTKSLDLLFKHS